MSLAGSAIAQAAGAIGASAISSGVNAKMQKEANKTNLQIAQETNQANRDIATETNQANADLAQQQFQHEKDMWSLNNEYNDPSNQVQRIQKAGINPLTAFSNGGNAGNSSAPAAVPDMANQVTGAPMVAATVDPITMDNSIADSILAFANNMTNRYNADTARLKANSDINVNEWSVKSVQQQIENMKTQRDIDLQMLPLMLQEKEAVIDDTKSSKKLKDKQREAIDTTIQIGQSQIYKNYADIIARYYELDIMQQNVDIAQQNADINQMNADTNRMNAETNAQNAKTQAEQVANSYDIALKNYEQMSLQQLLDYSKTFFSDKSYSNSFGSHLDLSASLGNGGSGSGSSGSSGGSILGVLTGVNIGANGGVNANDSKSGSDRSLNIDKAVSAYGRLAAYNVQLMEYIKNPGLSPDDRRKCIDILSRTSRLLEGETPYTLHRLRSEGITRGARMRMLQFPVDGYSNPMNQSQFPE